MGESCVFCEIIAGRSPASLVHEDALTVALVDLRQFHPGHMLVMPRAHLPDLRDLDEVTGAALMRTLVRVTRAVGEVFGNEGLSLWHSIGPAAFQEVPHLHIHVHPRRTNDRFLRVYPGPLRLSESAERERMAERMRTALGRAPEETSA